MTLLKQSSSELAPILERALELRLNQRYRDTQAMLSAIWNPKPIILPASPDVPEPDYLKAIIVGFWVFFFLFISVRAYLDSLQWNVYKAGEPPLKKTKTLEAGSRTAFVLLKEWVTALEFSTDGQVLAATRSYESSKEDELWFLDLQNQQILKSYVFKDEGRENPILKILHHANSFILILRNGTINTYSLAGELVLTKKIAPYLTQAAYSTSTDQLFIYKEPIHKYSRAYSSKDINRFSHGFFVLDAANLQVSKFVPMPYSETLKLEIIKARDSQVLFAKTELSTGNVQFWTIDTIKEKFSQMNTEILVNKKVTALNQVIWYKNNYEPSLLIWENSKLSRYDFDAPFACQPEIRTASQTILFATPEGLSIYNAKTKKKTKMYTRSSVSAEINFDQSELRNSTVWDYVRTIHTMCPYVTSKNGIIYAFDTNDNLLLRIK